MVQHNGIPPRHQSPRFLEQVRVAVHAKHYRGALDDSYTPRCRC
jgi:hypothetical protein